MSNTLPTPVDTGLKSLIPSTVRTLVPIVVTLLVGWGFSETALTGPVTAVLTLLVTAAYYVVVRLLEQHWDQIGWLLGYPKQPVYVKGEVVSSAIEPVVTDASPRSDVPPVPPQPAVPVDASDVGDGQMPAQ